MFHCMYSCVSALDAVIVAFIEIENDQCDSSSAFQYRCVYDFM